MSILQKRIANIPKREKKEKINKKKYPNKKDNNKLYRDFVKEARTWDKYKDMQYHEFLKKSTTDYYKYVNYE